MSLQIYDNYVIECDRCGEDCTSGLTYAEGAIKMAKDRGWRIGDEDVCPKCQLKEAIE